MTSGPSHILVLSKEGTGEGVIEQWRELLGPASVEEAKEQAPDRLVCEPDTKWKAVCVRNFYTFYSLFCDTCFPQMIWISARQGKYYYEILLL